MEEYQVHHIRNVLLVTLTVLAVIALYVRLLQYMKKDMDTKKYPVLLPSEMKENKVIVHVDVPLKTEVTVDLLDRNEEVILTILSGIQEKGTATSELELTAAKDKGAYIRLRSEGQEVIRKLDV